MSATRARVIPLLIITCLALIGACSGTASSTSTSTQQVSSSAGPASAGSEVAPTANAGSAESTSADPAQAAAILDLVEQEMQTGHLRSVLVRVTKDGQEIVTAARGESMTGVPATTDMHFRNGAVSISFVATLLLQLVDSGTVSLDDKVSEYLPDVPHADEVTLGQLAQMTSGIPDYVPQPQFMTELVSDPFAAWTPEQLLAEIADLPLHYPPGTNWNYSHSNYLILGLVLEKVTGKPVDELMTEKVLGPLGLDNTVNNATAAIPEPALHSFSSERRELFGVPADQPFYEESTFWNPSWTITRGAVQTTNIYDMAASMAAIGEGTLLSPASHAAQVSTGLRGFGTAQEGCSCFPQQEGYAYGIGVVTTGNWLLQNPLFSGEAGASAYLASQKIAIGVAVTYQPEAFDAQGNYVNQADILFRKIGALVAPDDAPPVKK